MTAVAVHDATPGRRSPVPAPPAIASASGAAAQQVQVTVHISISGEALPPAALGLLESLRLLASPEVAGAGDAGVAPDTPLARPRLVSLPSVLPDAVASDLLVQPAARAVYRDGQPVRLTRREFDLLAFFCEHPRRVFTRRQLLRQVWGYEPVSGERTVDVHVRRLRIKLGGGPAVIATVRGIGYRLSEGAPVRLSDA
jgi:two-component system, OmpR family, response regulator